ncbi:MAG: OstA-like protein [Salibacteraceae bacterium]
MQQIELLHADRLFVGKNTPPGANALTGHVRLKHQNALMYCDSALLFKNNTLKAFGNVRIVENDSLTVSSDSLVYDGNKRRAKLRGDVTIDNKTSILKTRYLDYDRNTGVAHYFHGGEIDSKKEKIHLTSRSGYYYASAKLFHFKKMVVLVHSDYTIYTDTMHYSTGLEKTWFFGPTRIEFDNRTIFCERGWFDQLADKSVFIKNARIVSGHQTLSGDTIQYDEREQIGIAHCNVNLADSNEKFEVQGDFAWYNEKDSLSFVTENLLLKQDLAGNTFYLVADTLFSLYDTTSGKKQRIVKTYYNCRFYKSDLQGKCDSLVFYTNDSIIQLYRNPVMWTDENQITADSLWLTLKNGTIDKMYMRRNAFIISKEDSVLFNQIKGSNMVGIFNNSRLTKVRVLGNGETVYYPREEDGALIGVNETRCSHMTILVDSNTIKRIHFYDKPTALLTPSDDMPPTGVRLDGFVLRFDERPWSVTDLVSGTSTKPEVLQPGTNQTTSKRDHPSPAANDGPDTRTGRESRVVEKPDENTPAPHPPPQEKMPVPNSQSEMKNKKLEKTKQ